MRVRLRRIEETLVTMWVDPAHCSVLAIYSEARDILKGDAPDTQVTLNFTIPAGESWIGWNRGVP